MNSAYPGNRHADGLQADTRQDAAGPIRSQPDRIRTLREYGVLDATVDPAFDEIVRLAAGACGVPIALLMLIDQDRQCCAAATGLDIAQVPSFSPIAMLAMDQADPLVLPDAGVDPRVSDDPLLRHPFLVRFWAGVPLRTTDGPLIGVLCVADRQPGGLGQQQLLTLRALARAVTAQLEQRRAIAERDRAVLAGQGEQSRFRQILDGAAETAIVWFDLEGRVSGWNQGACRVLGWTEAEMLGEPVDRLFTPDDVAAGQPGLATREALRHGAGEDQRWHMRRDGSRFLASSALTPLRDAAGTASGFVMVLRDRTGRHRAAHVLRDHEERINTALDTGLVGFFSWNVPAKRFSADRHFAALYGLDPERLADHMPIEEVSAAIHPDDRAAVTAGMRTAIGAGADFTRRFRIGGVDHGQRTLLVRGRCLERDGGRAVRFTGVAIDITAAADAAEALRASESFTRDILASSSDCIKVIGLDNTLQFMSEGGQRTMEVDDESSVIGCSWPSFWEGAGNALALDALRIARTGGRGQFQGFADTARGNRRFWDVVVTPMLGRDGRTERLLSISRDVTEAHSAAERIELALNTGTVLGTWLWDVKRDLVTADSRFAATFSLDAASLAAGVPLGAVVQSIHPDDLASVGAQIDRAVRDGGRYNAEYRVRQLDGSWRWVESNGRCELDETGTAVRFPGVLIDIDARKRQELRQGALIELGNHLRALHDAPSLIAAAAAILGRTLGVARAGYGIVDVAAEVVHVDQDWCADAAILPIGGRHDFRSFGSYIDDLKRNQVVAIADVALDPRTCDNSTAWRAVQIRGLLNVPLMDGDRMAAIVFAHTADVHAWSEEEIAFARAVADRTWAAIEQARAETALVRINEGLEALVAERTRERDGIWTASQDLLGVADPDGVWLSVSPAWTETLGWQRDEIVGRTSEWLDHPDDRNATRAEIAQLAQGRRTVDFQSRLRHRDGSYRVLSWAAVSVQGKLFCSARDVTEQNLAAENLARTEQALRQSQKMEAVGQLTGGLAHDFNNLLTGITGALELLGTRVSQGRYEEVDRYVLAAQGAAKRAAALTHRLLAFSRQQTLDPKPTDCRALVAGMEELIQRTIGPAIELGVTAPVDLWATLVDANQLENAVLNLCINARDAMPDGGRLTIALSNLALHGGGPDAQDMPTGEYLVVGVTDTGTGMSPDVIAKAFDPFFTTKPIGQGTGLGLSMIYGFVRQSGGQVRISSREGVGTTMRMLLPRHAGEIGAHCGTAAIDDLPRAAAGETVLVVDDEPTIRMLVIEVLEELGYTAIEARDGASGLEVLRSDARIDLLVTDVGLPGGMNGRQMADVARSFRAGLKVLFITGYAENAVLGDGQLDPGMHVITKPFGMEALTNQIRTLITTP